MHDAIECRRQGTAIWRRLGRIVVQNRRHGLGGGVALKGADAAEHFVEHRAEAENVGAAIHLAAANLLGRHVAGGSHHRSHAGGRDVGGHGGQSGVRASRSGFLDRLRETEVEDLHPAFARNKDVVGLQVAMGDVFAVRRRQAMRDLDGVIDGLAMRERAARENLAQALSLEQLGHHERRSIVLPDIVDAENVGMIEGGDGTRLLLEAPQAVGIGGKRGRQTFTATSRPSR